MRRFSKHDNQAICNYCGKWQPTDLTNQQLEEMDWKCDECKAKEQAAQSQQVTPPESDRGSKEISKYDPEYAFLVKLVKLLTSEGVPPQEIKSIADAYPFVTVDDVGDLTAKLWTLATEKYHIPREWLIKRLPKNASLKIATSKMSKPDSGYVDNGKGYTCGRCAYFDAKNQKCSLVQGEIKAQGCCNFWNDKVVEKLETPEYTKKEAVYIEYPNVDYRCDECVFFDPKAKTCTKVEGEISPTASCNLWEPITKKKADLWRGQEEADDMINHAPGYLAYQYGQDKESKNQSLNLTKAIEILNKGENKVISINAKDKTVSLVDGSVVSFDDAVKMAAELSKTADGFTGAEFSRNDVGVNPTVDIGPFSSPEDHGAKPQKSPFPNTGWLPADDENKDEQPYSNIASAFKPPFSKIAGLDGRYWIAPDGKEFNAGTHHGAWVNNNLKTLKAYGISGAENISEIYKMMFDSGWTRVSNERGFTIQVADLNRIPAYLDDFIAKHYQKGDIIRIGTDTQMVEISDPFPSLQRAINKQLRGGKRAALTPQAYWIDPKGTWYTVRASGLPEITHSGWARDNMKMLQEKYPELNIPKDTSRFDFYRALLQNGWVRIGDSRGASYQIQTADPLHLPSSIIDWVYQNVPNGSSIEIDDANGGLDSYVSLKMPVENLEKEIARALRHKKMSATMKYADLSGQTVNQIINALHANGGATWNLSQGNMVGTNNYAVAIYPDRAQILDGVDFDRVEEYILNNSDLLDNPENSFGAWSHDGKVYLDVVATIPDINQAVELGKKNNQIAIWDLKNGKQISTGGTGEVKQAAQNQILPQPLQDQIAAETSPAYNIALNNYAQAVRRGHEKDRSLEYAIESVSNIDKIDPKKLVELINKYL